MMSEQDRMMNKMADETPRSASALLHEAADLLESAADSVQEWGGYANAYFQEKWGLSGDVARLKEQADRLRELAPEPPTLVLVTRGKSEDVNSAQVMVFESEQQAKAFIAETRTGPEKYWVDARIVAPGDQVELERPDD